MAPRRTPRKNGCADPRSLWAVSDAGALARLDEEGVWTPVFGETAFEDAQGERPSTRDLTSAALSADGRWLLFGSRRGGVGLYDQQRRVWVRLDAEELVHLPSPSISHLLWWNDRFWIGGPEGLSFLVPDAIEPRIGVREDLSGATADLGAAEALWVLERRRCVNDAQLDCMRLSRLTDPQRTGEAMIYEMNRYPQLDLAGLRVAQVQTVQGGSTAGGSTPEEFLVVAGRAGVFSYEPNRHTWKQHVEEPMLAHYRDGEDGLWIGTGGAVSYLSEGLVKARWALPSQRVRRISPAADGKMFALTEEGDVRTLHPGGEVTSLFTASSSGFDLRRSYDALVLGDGKVIFRGREGLLIHDVLERSYRDVARGRLPDWLFDPSVKFVAAAEKLFALLPETGLTSSLHTILVSDPDQLASGDFDEPGRVPSPVTATALWGRSGLAMLAGDGSAYLARQETVHRMTGLAAPELDGLVWKDVALDSKLLAVATRQGVRTYHLAERTWQDRILTGTPVEELALLPARSGSADPAQHLRIRTADGRLVRPDPEDGVLIGDQQTWSLSNSTLSDARLVDGQIYLAGAGRVHRYDPERRRLAWRWELGSSAATRGTARGAVRLVDVLGSAERAQPLALTGGRAYLGSIAIDPAAGRVRGMSLGQRYAWTVREPTDGGSRYLKGHFRGRPFEASLARCLFRHASAGEARPLDAREVRPRMVAVATDRGLKLYSRDTRSWYEVRWRGQPLYRQPLYRRSAELPEAGGMLYRLGAYLALWTGEDDSRLFLIDPEDLRLPHSCGDSAVVEVEPKLAVEPVAVAFDEAADMAAWILPDGSVRQWRQGGVETLLAPSRGAPRTRDLRRLYRAGDKLVFTTEVSLVVYDLATHRWLGHVVASPGGRGDPLTELDLAGAGPEATELTLTATTASGAVHVGTFEANSGRIGTLELTEVLSPNARRLSGSLGAPPEDVLDVQWRLGKWAFVLPERLAIYDPEARRWEKGFDFPGEGDRGLSLRQAVGLDVLIENEGRRLWIEQDARGASTAPRWASFLPGDAVATAIDERARVWRLNMDGSVERCQASGRDYTCDVEIAADASNPVVALEAGPGGAGLVARHVDEEASPTLTGLSVELDPRLPPAVDVGWFSWVREPEGQEPGHFRVATASGPKRLTRQELIRDGRLLFEDVRAVHAETPNLFHAATPHGVWTFRGTSLSLARRNQAAFLPAQLGTDVRVAHGRFFTPRASLSPREGVLEPDPEPRHRVAVGGRVELIEDVRERRVRGLIRTRDGAVPAFDESGFAWDRRRDLAFHPRLGMVLMTGAGIHPLRIGAAIDTFDPGPEGRARHTGRLSSSPEGGLFFHDTVPSGGSRGGGDIRNVYELGAGGWTRTDPTRTASFDRTLVESGFWTWQRRGERLVVTLQGSNHGFALRSGPSGWQLTSDRLRSAVFHGERLHLLSDAFLEVIGENVGTGSLARLHAAPGVERLESLGGELYAWSRPGPQVSRWDAGASSFVPLDPGHDPLVERDLLTYGPLRVTLRGGRVVQELLVEDPRRPPASRRTSWKRIELTSEGFAFDRVTAIGTTGGRLLVHSPAGLQVYPASASTSLAEVESILDLGRGSARLGRPEGAPDRFLVVTNDGCFEWKDTLEPCVEASSLVRRWRGESGFWRFNQSGGRARGFYKDSGGRLTGTEVTVRGGRFAHDRLRDLALCGGEAVSLWQNGWITRYREDGLALAAALNFDELAAGRPRELICQEQDRPLDGTRLESGLYVAGGAGTGRYWRWEGSTFSPVTDSRHARALADPPLQQYGRLRLAQRRGSFTYQYRTSDRKWIGVPWSDTDGRLAIDVIEHIRQVGSTLWAATPTGLSAFGLDGSGQLRLDPDALTWIRAPRTDAGAPACRITDFEVEGETATLRCGHDSNRLFVGRLEPGKDSGVFQPSEDADPFVERPFVTEESSGYWDWRLVGRQGGDPGGSKRAGAVSLWGWSKGASTSIT